MEQKIMKQRLRALHIMVAILTIYALVMSLLAFDNATKYYEQTVKSNELQKKLYIALEANNNLGNRVLRLEKEIEEANVGLISEEQKKEVLFTSYHTNDGSSGTTTASGLSTDDFQTNENGWYTYKGRVVLATANLSRVDKPLFNGYSSHELYDELTIEFDGVTYEAVVLDVCGACYGVLGEYEQRYDIFTNGSGIGKKGGFIYE